MADVGARVVVRYRLPAGSTPPMTDVIGHLVAVGPPLSVRSKRGDLVDIAAENVVAIKALSDAPVRTGDSSNLHHAAASRWPGVEQQWVRGCLLRVGHRNTRRANSAVPLNLDDGAHVEALVDW